jgi:23S rRNA (adenine1618-N6)-methyltransferase
LCECFIGIQFFSWKSFGAESVDFANPLAVKALNKALLNHYYGIQYWDFPNENLCPPIPGRVDYIHHMADLLSEGNSGIIPKGNSILCLDVGVGASCIYPILAAIEYGWKCIGSDIDSKSIESAMAIVDKNPSLVDLIECRLQPNKKDVFFGILSQDEKLDFSICNPPFHSSLAEAQKGSRRKIKNLTGKTEAKPILNFAGIGEELICEGGESKFIHNMITESAKFSKNCFWFSTLVSKQSNLKGIYSALEKTEVKQIKTIPMGSGNKSSRIVAWTFLSTNEQKEWGESRWGN